VSTLKKKRINDIFFESVPSKGVRDGVITDAIALVGVLGRLMKSLRAKSGINIKAIYTNISGEDILTKHSRAIIPLAERGNKVITMSDIQKVNEQARILGSSLDEEIIHIVPLGYSIDSKSNILNPLGLYSHRLEVDLFLICAKLSSIQSLSRAVNQAGYEIKDLLFSGLATSKAVFDERMSQGLNIFCDIGSDITELLILRNGVLKDIEILRLGGASLTVQLSDVLKMPAELAEDIKRSYGAIGGIEHIGHDKEILVKKSSSYKPIKQREVSEVITSAAKLICSQIKEEVQKKVSFHEVNNFVIAGRAVMLEGFIETLENTLGLPVVTGRISSPEIQSALKERQELSGHKYLTYLTCLGMLSLVLQGKSPGIPSEQKLAKNLLAKAVNRVKEVYQEYF